MTETLLINFFFILFPVLIYLIFFESRLKLNQIPMLFLTFSSFPLILTMTFPIEMELGFNYDLRFVPFIIASLYVGYKVAFPLYLILNIYRFFIGGEGIVESFLFSTAAFLLIPIWSRKFLQLTPKKRVIWGGIASLLLNIFYLITLTSFFPTLNHEYWTIVANIIPIHVISVMTMIMMIEKIRTNMENREKLMQSERLSVISELSASVSHEIRNPLTSTSGFLQLLNESKNISPDEKRYIDLSLQELKRAEKIISDFLSFAKPQAENMVTSNFKEEIEYVNNIMIPYANLHLVDLHFQFTNSLTKRFDQNQIQQALINLYKNGIEAMKETGGSLHITVSERNDIIQINISDTGVGMTEEECSLMGKPYYSTKTEGTGLGMVMVYTVFDKIGGKIEVTSQKGTGTTFLITIPAG